MDEPPQTIRAHQSDQVLELAWTATGGMPTRVPYRLIRGHCPCASCKDEWTGERLVDINTLPDDLKLAGMDPVGNYAVRLTWTDGHSSGLYTWALLHDLASAVTAAAAMASGHSCSNPNHGHAGCDGRGGCGAHAH
jgi:DUF971 family protein